MLKYSNIEMIPSYSKITKTTKNCNIQGQAYLDGLKGILTESLLIPSCSNETIFKQKFSVNSSLLLTGYWWSVLSYEQKIAFLYYFLHGVYLLPNSSLTRVSDLNPVGSGVFVWIRVRFSIFSGSRSKKRVQKGL